MNPKEQRIDAERYAHLRDTLADVENEIGGGLKIMVMPNGGADRLIERLKCRGVRAAGMPAPRPGGSPETPGTDG